MITIKNTKGYAIGLVHNPKVQSTVQLKERMSFDKWREYIKIVNNNMDFFKGVNNKLKS